MVIEWMVGVAITLTDETVWIAGLHARSAISIASTDEAQLAPGAGQNEMKSETDLIGVYLGVYSR